MISVPRVSKMQILCLVCTEQTKRTEMRVDQQRRAEYVERWARLLESRHQAIAIAIPEGDQYAEADEVSVGWWPFVDACGDAQRR